MHTRSRPCRGGVLRHNSGPRPCGVPGYGVAAARNAVPGTDVAVGGVHIRGALLGKGAVLGVRGGGVWVASALGVELVGGLIDLAADGIAGSFDALEAGFDVLSDVGHSGVGG